VNADEAATAGAEAAGLDGAATYGAEAGGAIEGEAAGREPPSTEEDRVRCF